MKKQVLVLKDANGDVDSIFVQDSLSIEEYGELNRRAARVGLYLDWHDSAGDVRALDLRLYTLEQEK